MKHGEWDRRGGIRGKDSYEGFSTHSFVVPNGDRALFPNVLNRFSNRVQEKWAKIKVAAIPIKRIESAR